MKVHYYSVEFDNEYAIYFTDFVFDALICTFPLNSNIELIVKELNHAYNSGFQDGQNSALDERFRDLVDENISLNIQLQKLK